ncbi:major capsid protein [Halomonas sp. McH1-25]|uniref:major capsid protein n=1 Tax=unclassified Halomonas TaxID=2609666 RepID=UPI001EF4379D|nr:MULTISPECIES: major capsid protein [unclassified Halomonas]MCG7598876.1 major capsid protein [Halomonas sp. McH1-25]MCP1340839.1 major capsid protein [Halomonas sp. FL8]MCP1361278.1 major capsid protein [Halomonas sp. BBD45]MCP1363695.1 major capsid protein [Halomonas sp. BBD48]
MATTVNSDMIIYNDLAQTAYLERIQEVFQVFNAASQGAIVLDSELIEGDFRRRAFYKIGGAIEHRDVNATSAVTGKKISNGEMVGVKIPFKYGPYETTEEAFKRRARSPEEFSMLVGQDYADAVMQGRLSFATAALKAAIAANANMSVAGEFSTDGKILLTKALRRFGDRFNRVSMWLMDSASYFDIVDNAIAEKIYEEAGTVIYGGQPGTMGRPVLVTDETPANSVFGLQQGAVTVTESQAPGFRSYPINDQENLAMGFRAEGTFNLELLGYSWDDTVGGANPTLAAIGTGANWTKYATSDKNTAGVLIDTTPAATT